MSPCETHRAAALDFVDDYQNWKHPDCPWCRIRALEADLAALSDKACAAVLIYRTALSKLTDSFKYSTEVVTIAREALLAGANEVAK